MKGFYQVPPSRKTETQFSVPSVQPEVPLMSSEKASENAFYTAATSSNSPIEDYSLVKNDLEQTGQSVFMSSAQERWQKEADENTKQAILNIVTDSTIDNSLKRAIVNGYAVTGVIPSSLKDKYIDKTAVKDSSINQDDVQTQNLIVDTLEERKKNNAEAVEQEKIHNGSTSLMDVIKGVGGVASSMLMSIPAGFAGVYQAIKEQDSSKASEIISSIQQAGYMPEGDGVKHVKETIAKIADTLSIPAKWLGEKTLNITGSPAAATAVEIGLDPINFIPVGLITGKIKGVAKIAAKSPLAATAVANPKIAEAAALGILKDETGKLSEALGADKGQVVHDWVLPKIFPEEIAKSHPDLLEAITKNDETIRNSFQELRYDPNVINATKREQEVASVFQVIKESSKPYYNQSMSLINETDQLFEGNAVFGRNGTSGYIKESVAQEAYTKLKESIDHLPEESRGTLEIVKHDGQHYLNWQWKKEYDDLSTKIFGPDSVQTSFLGLDVSGVARSRLGRWLFPTGRFPTWTEQGALRGEERIALLRDDLTKTIKERIANKGHGVELDYLIRDAEEKGIDYYSPAKISSMFPKMSQSAVDDLFTTHTFWRRQQQYNHNFMNREVRHKLLDKEMQGIYDDAGNYLGVGTSKVGAKELETIKEVFDFETKKTAAFIPEELQKSGKTLVRLNEKIKGEGTIHQYALIGKEAKLNLLPQEVLPRIPGYSGRKVKESWYVDVLPKSLMVNGIKESDTAGLRAFAETRAAARTEVEAIKLGEELQAKNPDHVISVRPERSENFGRVITDYQIHQELLSHSMKRGEILPSINGPARIEDRMVTLINTTNSIARMGAMRAWDDSFQSAFTKGFAKFTKGEFPQYATDIKPLENMDRVLKKEYDNAHALFKYYERIKNSETISDFMYTKILHSLADTFEKWKIPNEFLKGNHKNPLMFAKTISTAVYIHLAPIRQHLIQPMQQLEMYAVNPKAAVKNFANTSAIRMYLSADSSIVKHSGMSDIIKQQAEMLGTKAGEKEFLATVDAIQRSGMMQSVDLNSIVHGVIKEVDRHLVENVPERIWKDIEATAKAPFRAARAVGFDAAELNNRVGNWLQVRDLWVEHNPGKNWNTKEIKEQISAEALKISGAMNRAGQLPYQEGMLSIPFQFSAINHKMLMNVLQDNATILTGMERARLSAARFALFGGKYGIPGGAIAYNFIEKSDNKDLKDNAEMVKRGFIDSAANGLLASVVEPDTKPDLAISKILSPYSEGFLPYFSVGWETMKLFDDRPAGPRYPSFGMMSSFGQAIEDMKGWYVSREVNDKNFKQMAMEAAEVASGFSSYQQGLLMLGMRDKITRAGNKYGMEFTAAEAYAKMVVGLGTQKEEDLWNLVELEKDTAKQKKDMAKSIYSQLANQRVKGNEEEYDIRVRKINSFVNMLDPVHFSEADKLEVINEIEKLDKHNYTTIKQSILVDHWKYHQEKMTQERQQVNDILGRSNDPEVKRYLKALNEGNL